MRELLERCERFMAEFGIPRTKFCERINVAVSTWHAWKSGRLKLSRKTEERIDAYLRQYGF